MKFSYTIIYVNDVEQTVNFYQKAFKLSLGFMHESKTYAEMDTGTVKLAFAATTLAKSNGVEFRENNPKEIAAGMEIAFTCDDAQQSYQDAIDNGAIDVKAPVQKLWGQTVAYIRDINSVLVEIASPIGI